MSFMRAAAGWVAALAVGVGGAYGAISLPFEARQAKSTTKPVVEDGWIDVSERSGLIEEQRREGWVPLSAPRAFGGIRVRAVGRESKLVLKAGPLTASAAMEAELAISMLGAPTVILESGHLLASSEIGSAIVYVPSFGVWLKGAKLGALLEGGRLSVATLAHLEVTKPGHRPELFPPGQEIVIDRDALQPYVLDSVLQVRLEQDKKKRVSALTSPAALVMVETESGLDAIAPDSTGRALLPKKHRALFAIDPLGRVASVTAGRAQGSRRTARGAKEEEAIPLSIQFQGSALGEAVIDKPEASLPPLKEESALEKELGELDEATRKEIKDF